MSGYLEGKDDIEARLRKIEGQVRGIHRMVHEDAYCIDVLTQITAASNALKKVAVGLLNDHMKDCVVEDSREGTGNDRIAEATKAIERLIKA